MALDTNHYSVPARYAHTRVTLKAWPDRVCIYHNNLLIARHVRSYDRHQDIEDPEHPKALLEQRRSAREQRLMLHFLSLGPHAQAYYEGLEQRRTNARQHMRKIIALSGWPDVPRLQLRVHRQHPRDEGPAPAGARRTAPDPSSGSAGHRTCATGSLALWTGGAL
ncbi:hypothetical protein KNO81_40980 [Paraburkholderia sediminicola]|nr:hypothetical protein [Paraburkholderia sediminicola]